MTEMPSFEPAVFRELNAALGADDTIEVLKTFLDDTSRKISAIASDLQARPSIRREAHSIKSSAATFGFTDLSTRARELELSAEAMDPVQLHEFVEAFRQLFEKTAKFAEAHLLNAGREIAR